jgi:hypothetical protein
MFFNTRNQHVRVRTRSSVVIYFYLQVRRFLGFSTAFRVSPSNICASYRARLTFASVYECACDEVSLT